MLSEHGLLLAAPVETPLYNPHRVRRNRDPSTRTEVLAQDDGSKKARVGSYCLSSTNVETLPNRLLSTTVVICFPSAETVTFSMLSTLPSRL